MLLLEDDGGLSSIETLRTLLLGRSSSVRWVLSKDVRPIGVVHEFARQFARRENTLGAVRCVFDQRVSASFALVLSECDDDIVHSGRAGQIADDARNTINIHSKVHTGASRAVLLRRRKREKTRENESARADGKRTGHIQQIHNQSMEVVGRRRRTRTKSREVTRFKANRRNKIRYASGAKTQCGARVY